MYEIKTYFICPDSGPLTHSRFNISFFNGLLLLAFFLNWNDIKWNPVVGKASPADVLNQTPFFSFLTLRECGWSQFKFNLESTSLWTRTCIWTDTKFKWQIELIYEAYCLKVFLHGKKTGSVANATSMWGRGKGVVLFGIVSTSVLEETNSLWKSLRYRNTISTKKEFDKACKIVKGLIL